MIAKINGEMSATCPHPQEWGRILIVAAHPDDEVLALGGHFAALKPNIFHLTSGSRSDDALADERAREMHRVLELAGIPAEHFFAGKACDQQAVDSLSMLAAELATAIARSRPDCLLTHAYEGGHPDHDAAALLCSRATTGLPLYEFPSYHNATPWQDEGTWETSRFLDGPPVLRVELTPGQRADKRALLAAFRSQAEVLWRFDLTREQFRVAPVYDFTKPPHAGRLLYEAFGWRTFPSWRQAADVGR